MPWLSHDLCARFLPLMREIETTMAQFRDQLGRHAPAAEVATKRGKSPSYSIAPKLR